LEEALEVGEKDGVFEFFPFVPVAVAFVLALPALPLQAHLEGQCGGDAVLLQQWPLIRPHLLLSLHICNYYLKTTKSSPDLIIKLQRGPQGAELAGVVKRQEKFISPLNGPRWVKLKIIKVEAGLRYYRGGLQTKAGRMGWQRSVQRVLPIFKMGIKL
jgi:hypothetical protein